MMSTAKERKLLQQEARIKQSRLELEYVKKHFSKAKQAMSGSESTSGGQNPLKKSSRSIVSGVAETLQEPWVQKLLALFLTAWIAERIQAKPGKKHRFLRWLSRLL